MRVVGRVLDAVAGFGAAALDVVREMGRMGLFLVQTLVTLVTTVPKVRWLFRRIAFIGFHSVLLVALCGAFTGMVLAFQGYYTLAIVGSTAMLGPLVGLSLLRELGPVLTALIVIGRAGSALTAEVGIMRISEEIDALHLMGLNPLRYLAVPILLAWLVCLPLLTAIFNVLGIFGGWLVGVRLLGVPSGVYLNQMDAYVELWDVTSGLWKAFSFGAFIAWITTYKGYGAGFGAEGVSRATTQAVVMSSVVVLVWDYFMTSVML